MTNQPNLHIKKTPFILLLILFSISFTQLYAQPTNTLQPLPENKSILISSDFLKVIACSEIPCMFRTDNGEQIYIAGNVSQDANNNVMIKTKVFVNGNYNGEVYLDLNFENNKTTSQINVTGFVVRDPNNYLGLPAKSESLGGAKINLTNYYQDISQNVTQLTHREIAILTLSLIFSDNTPPISVSNPAIGMASMLSSPTSRPDRIRHNPLGPSGPTSGFLLIPLPTSICEFDCGILHDVCLTNATSAAAKKKCNDDFATCIRDCAPFFSFFFTEVVVVLVDGFGPSGDGDPVDCQCNLTDISKAALHFIRTIDYDRIIIKDSWCPTTGCSGDCAWIFEKHFEENEDPENAEPYWWPVLQLKGECGHSL